MEFLCAAPRGLIGADGGEDSLLSRGGGPNRSVDNGTEKLKQPVVGGRSEVREITQGEMSHTSNHTLEPLP